MALCYWGLPGTMLDVWLYLYGLSLGTEHDRNIAVILGSVAAIHLCYLVWMLGWSLQKRQFVFAVYDIFPPSRTDSIRINKRLHRYARNVYRAVLSSIGVLSVDSPYFDLVLICREIVETALQTQQAYRMSVLLPRTRLNRCYVALLVINCWSTALIHSTFHKISTKRRFYVIVCDSVLDMVSSVGISTVILAIYAVDFDFELGEFPSYKWYEDVWLMHVLSEFHLVLVTSWSDLVMRLVFSLSMLGNMDNMKKLLCTTTTSAIPSEVRKLSVNRRRSSIVPASDPKVTDVKHAYRKNRLQILIESRVMQGFFGMWGAALLILHLYAESISSVPQCAMQVKPWGTSVPSCSLFVLDCHAVSMDGVSDEVSIQWSTFDRSTTSGLVIRHCPHFEVPVILTEFKRLKLLKFYNTTITEWNESAALSQTRHPSLVMLFLVRVNMTNGELPTGLQGSGFPKSLMDIEFCNTNLRVLPDDLDLKWPKSGTIYFEASNLSTVPDSLVRLSPYVTSLALNPIASIPESILMRTAGYLHVGGTLITGLPQTAKISPFFKLRVDRTNVSFFWDWVDPMVAHAGLVYNSLPTILATGSPYCSELQRIFEGSQSNFSAPWRQGVSMTLSDASPENWATLKKAVSCGAWTQTLYPVEFEDNYSKIATELD
ncbi:hypothetical protein AM587_10013770 [Phytophthora nicotianae]|nr:hypothetical protein AM587_10013770 [Phytophthora nicotianae]